MNAMNCPSGDNSPAMISGSPKNSSRSRIGARLSASDFCWDILKASRNVNPPEARLKNGNGGRVHEAETLKPTCGSATCGRLGRLHLISLIQNWLHKL